MSTGQQQISEEQMLEVLAGGSLSQAPTVAPAAEPAQDAPAEGQAQAEPATQTTPATPAAPAAPATDAPATEGGTGTAPQAPDFIGTLKEQLKGQGYSEEQLKELSADNWQQVVATKAVRPEALALQRALDSGMTVDQYYAALNEPTRLLKLSDEELYAESLRARFGKSAENPDGWDEEKINRTVQAKEASGTLAIDAEELRLAIKRDMAERKAVAEPARQDPPTEQRMSAEQEAAFSEAVNASVKSLAAQGGFFGIEAGDLGDAAALSARASKLLMPDPKTGVSITESRLKGNDGYLKMALLLDMAETGQLRDLLKGKADAVRRSILDQLDLTPGSEAGSVTPKTDQLDLDRLAGPSGMYGRGS